MARCFIDTGDDDALDRAVTDGRVLPEEADAIRDFRDLLRGADSRHESEEGSTDG